MPTIKPVRISCHAPKNGNENRRSHGRIIDDGQRAERAFPGLLRTDLAAQRMAAENFPESERGDVIQFRCENDVANEAVGVRALARNPR